MSNLTPEKFLEMREIKPEPSVYHPSNAVPLRYVYALMAEYHEAKLKEAEDNIRKENEAAKKSFDYAPIITQPLPKTESLDQIRIQKVEEEIHAIKEAIEFIRINAVFYAGAVFPEQKFSDYERLLGQYRKADSTLRKIKKHKLKENEHADDAYYTIKGMAEGYVYDADNGKL